MRKPRKLLISLIALFIAASIHSVGVAQPPPPPAGGHGQATNNPPGAGAPVGEGIIILMGLAGLYGSKKIYDFRRKLKNEK